MLGNQDGIELGLPECSADVNTYGTFEGFYLCDWIVSVVGIEIGNNEVIKLGVWDGKMIGTELGNMGRSSLGTYDDTELGCTDVNSDGKYEVFL